MLYFSEEIRNYVQELEKNKTAVETINAQDPFDYIQNWGRIYRGNKSPHAHFTLMKTLIHSFSLYLYPYNPSELNMTFKFEGIEEPLNLDYYIYMPNFREMNKLLGMNFTKKK